ncbi:unnamed protein product [Effrenium voratum]|uniref:Uncharacterized protein n=1 Tax=Effrenium voratum TaxID=2562239 RepID=A0AA36J3G4_9DINO|nr:unnamed protein product [Effrenium voratum]CAJ1428213.1 unnamed protein product [Effrenium voratum]
MEDQKVKQLSLEVPGQVVRAALSRDLIATACEATLSLSRRTSSTSLELCATMAAQEVQKLSFSTDQLFALFPTELVVLDETLTALKRFRFPQNALADVDAGEGALALALDNRMAWLSLRSGHLELCSLQEPMAELQISGFCALAQLKQRCWLVSLEPQEPPLTKAMAWTLRQSPGARWLGLRNDDYTFIAILKGYAKFGTVRVSAFTELLTVANAI